MLEWSDETIARTQCNVGVRTRRAESSFTWYIHLKHFVVIAMILCLHFLKYISLLPTSMLIVVGM